MTARGRLLWLGALLWLAAAAPGALAARRPPDGPWAPLKEGATVAVVNGSFLLAALFNNTGDIMLCDDIIISPKDWQMYELPIVIDAPGETILLRSDSSIFKKMIDWSSAVGLLEVTSNTTLAFNGIDSRNPGNRTQGIEQLEVEVKRSPLWPTVTGEDGHSVVVDRSEVAMDTAMCNPSFVQVEVARIQEQMHSSEAVTYYGGTTTGYHQVAVPAPLYDTLTKQQVGTAAYLLNDMNITCFDSAYQPPAGSGTPAWVWAVVGSVAGVVALAAAAAAFVLWRRRRRAQQVLHLPAGRADSGDLEKGKLGGSCHGHLSKDGSVAELHSLGSGALSSLASSHDKLAMSGQASGEVNRHFMRTRFGPIDGVQLGELLGRGAFGRVYRGRWKGAVVAVKVIDHRVQQGKTHDLSREPLLSMSVSHPNVVITHKMCVVRVVSAADEDGDAEPPSPGGSSASKPPSESGSGSASGSAGGQLVPALGGDGMVEVVSHGAVLQPGMYETWLVCEYCDRASLADLLARGQLAAADAQQRPIWLLLCLLDIAQGLEYLHSNTIIHGDLKPANVLLKAARNDRRGFVCKLGDFGLSRMLGQEESHVETQSYGTASYAAPELLAEGKLTKAADIYSLGIIIWELLTGEELYPGLTAMQVILQVSQHRVRPDVPPDCPPALADLMQRCWSHDPLLRPDAQQVVDEVRAQLMARRPQQAAAPQPPAGGA